MPGATNICSHALGTTCFTFPNIVVFKVSVLLHSVLDSKRVASWYSCKEKGQWDINNAKRATKPISTSVDLTHTCCASASQYIISLCKDKTHLKQHIFFSCSAFPRVAALQSALQNTPHKITIIQRRKHQLLATKLDSGTTTCRWNRWLQEYKHPNNSQDWEDKSGEQLRSVTLPGTTSR